MYSNHALSWGPVAAAPFFASREKGIRLRATPSLPYPKTSKVETL